MLWPVHRRRSVKARTGAGNRAKGAGRRQQCSERPANTKDVARAITVDKRDVTRPPASLHA